VREAKALVKSAWFRRRGRGAGRIYVHAIANGGFRACDPWFKVNGAVAVRRLSPNNRKIEAEDAVDVLLLPEIIRAMGFEIANVHASTASSRAAIVRDLRKRKADWLVVDAKRAADAVAREYADWRS